MKLNLFLYTRRTKYVSLKHGFWYYLFHPKQYRQDRTWAIIWNAWLSKVDENLKEKRRWLLEKIEDCNCKSGGFERGQVVAQPCERCDKLKKELKEIEERREQ